MENGWVKLYRKTKDKGFWKNSKYVHLWVHLLISANHKEKEFLWNKQTIKVSPGQIITGRSKLAVDTGIKESTVENILKFLENEQQIKQQKTTKFRLITIINWDKYQGDEQQIEQQSDNKVTTDEQQSDTNKNEENVKNEENNTPISPKKGKSKKLFKLSPDKLEAFNKFYSLFPKKKGRAQAEITWNKLYPDHVSLEKLLVLLKEDLYEFKGRDENMIPNPSSWLNARWKDDPREVKDYSGMGKQTDIAE